MSVLNTVKACTSLPQHWKTEVENYPMCRSFMHIHLGFDATGTNFFVLRYLHIYALYFKYLITQLFKFVILRWFLL